MSIANEEGLSASDVFRARYDSNHNLPGYWECSHCQKKLYGPDKPAHSCPDNVDGVVYVFGRQELISVAVAGSSRHSPLTRDFLEKMASSNPAIKIILRGSKERKCGKRDS